MVLVVYNHFDKLSANNFQVRVYPGEGSHVCGEIPAGEQHQRKDNGTLWLGRIFDLETP